MTQRHFVPDAECAARLGSLMDSGFIFGAFPSRNHRVSALDCSIGGTALPLLGTKLSEKIAVRRVARRCSARVRFAGALK